MQQRSIALIKRRARYEIIKKLRIGELTKDVENRIAIDLFMKMCVFRWTSEVLMDILVTNQ